MKITVNVINTNEAYEIFQTPEMKIGYKKELEESAGKNYFLDNFAQDIKRLSKDQCELFQLDYEKGYYVIIWNDEYILHKQ